MSSLAGLYDNYRPLQGYLKLVWRTLNANGNARRRAALNRATDYLALSSRRNLLPLHADFSAILGRQAAEWPHYDYGEGYFYQGMSKLGITGLRSTEERVRAFDLASRVKGKTVLDIGCNAGFVALSVAHDAARVVGCDVNPLLIEIANSAARQLRAENTTFLASGFESAHLDPVDVVMSLANHSTYDGQTAYDLEAYFDRCHSLLKPGGLFIFESHTPSFEGKGIDKVIALVGKRFQIREQTVLDYGTYLDRGRTMLIADIA